MNEESEGGIMPNNLMDLAETIEKLRVSPVLINKSLLCYDEINFEVS